MKDQERDPMEVLASAVARAIGLPIDPAYLPGVGQNLSLLYQAAAKMQDAEVPPEFYPLPIYRP